MKTYKIHLIRHGLTEGNLKGQYIGSTDLPLLPEGEVQIKKLAAEYGYPEVRRVYASPLSRCAQTAGLIYKNRNIITVEAFRERNFGCYEGQTAVDLQKDSGYLEWIRDGGMAAPAGGEDAVGFTKRVTDEFDKIVYDLMRDGITSAAVVAHGAVIMAIMVSFALPERDMFSYMCQNGSGYTLNITPSLWMRGQKAELFAEIPTGDSSKISPEQASLLGR